MIKQIKATFKFNIDEMFGTLGITALLAVFGIVISVIVNITMKADGEAAYILLGSFVACLGSVMISFFAGMFTVANRFQLMITMGRTRKEFIAVYICVEMLYTVLQLAGIWFIVFIEWILKKTVYSGLICKFDCAGFLLDFRTIICALLLLPTLQLFFGALFVKFGVKAYWALCIGFWGLGIACRNDRVRDVIGDAYKWCSHMLLSLMVETGSTVILLVAVFAVAAIQTAVGVLIFRKQSVRI